MGWKGRLLKLAAKSFELLAKFRELAAERGDLCLELGEAFVFRADGESRRFGTGREVYFHWAG